jgi:hypothetical protein
MAADVLTHGHAKASLSNRTVRTIPIFAVGMSLSLFFAISYLLCVVGYLLLPGLPINHAALAIFLPGFQLLTWVTFVLGLVESLLYGWYVALIFVPLYNVFVSRMH